MSGVTFAFFQGKALGILCKDGTRLSGIAVNLDSDKGTLSLSQVTRQINHLTVKQDLLVMNRGDVADVCVYANYDKMGQIPDLSDFKNAKVKPNTNQYVNPIQSSSTQHSIQNQNSFENYSQAPNQNFKINTGYSDNLASDFEHIDINSDAPRSNPPNTQRSKSRQSNPNLSDYSRRSSNANFVASQSYSKGEGQVHRKPYDPFNNISNQNNNQRGNPNQRKGNYRNNEDKKDNIQKKFDRIKNHTVTPVETDGFDESDFNNSQYHSGNKNKYNKKRPPINHPRTNHHVVREKVDWQTDHIEDQTEEFDFEHNLGLFDKKAMFGKLRANDPIPHQDRLVGHNRKPKESYSTDQQSAFPPPPTRNLLPNENVLDDNNPLSFNEICNGPDFDNSKPDRQPECSPSVYFKSENGARVPFVDRWVIDEVTRIASEETGPNSHQILENAGRSIALMALKAIGGTKRFRPSQKNTAPMVIVLAGNNRTGIYTMCAARHLANRSCNVYLIPMTKPNNFGKTMSEQHLYAKFAGVNIVSTINELPDTMASSPDLIIDALLGVDMTLEDLPDSNERILTCNSVDWANSSQAPVLSIDLPAGLPKNIDSNISPITGAVQPRWTLSLGAPNPYLGLAEYLVKEKGSKVGAVYLADIGLPNSVWKRAGVEQWQSPYGAAYVTRLDAIDL